MGMRRILAESEAKKVLKEYGIPVPEESIARSEEEALRIARRIGYPVVLKLISPDILHKSKANCVLMNVESEEGVAIGYREIIKRAKKYKSGVNIQGVLVQKKIEQGREIKLGAIRDETIGPAVVFSLGGLFSDILGDITYRIAPVSKEEALKMMKEISAYSILEGAAGERSDLHALAETIEKLSRLVMEREEIAEMDLDPLFVYEKGVLAVDAKMMLR